MPRVAHDEGLYPALLGGAWAGLPQVVRRLHQEGRARGQVTIERGRHWPARLLAQILGFPPAGDNVATLLAVERRGAEQVWSRCFGGHTMISRQRLRPEGLVAERFGSLECVFRLRPTDAGIDYELAGVALNVAGLRLPVPRLLAPRGAATTWAEGDAMGLDISISAPLVGRILRYHGLVRPEGEEAPA
jgi:Domain of unknown function (DUF4166)